MTDSKSHLPRPRDNPVLRPRAENLIESNGSMSALA
jgi:hypothetical protein